EERFRDDETEDAVAEKFEAFVAAVRRAGFARAKRAAMRQRVREQVRVLEAVSQDLLQWMPAGGHDLRRIVLVDAVEEAREAHGERPTPNFPQPGTAVGRKEDELGAADQVFGRDKSHVSPAIERDVA